MAWRMARNAVATSAFASRRRSEGIFSVTRLAPLNYQQGFTFHSETKGRKSTSKPLAGGPRVYQRTRQALTCAVRLDVTSRWCSTSDLPSDGQSIFLADPYGREADTQRWSEP